MHERQWWNGRWSRLVRRDVFLRNTADGRWQVELRRGGPDGRLRVRPFDAEGDAVSWIESVVDPDAGWREIGRAAVLSVSTRRAAKSDSRKRRKVAQDLDRAG